MRISDWSSDVCSSDLFVRLASVLIVGIGIVLIIAPDPIKTGFGLALLLGGGTAFVLAHFRTKVRDELDIDEIVTQPDDVLERNLRALDDFRNLIARRSEERRVGKGCVSTFRSRWSPTH